MTVFIGIVLLLLTLLFFGLPVAFSLGATSTLLLKLFDLPFQIVGQTIYSSLDSFVLLAVPLFIAMSQVLLEGKVGADLFTVMNAWVRHLPGGLAIATVLSCAFFSAITGSSAATAATIGMIAFPALISRGYDRTFTLGLLAAGATLGILIPPSIPLILYGAVTEESVGKLFMAGIVPGLVLTGLFTVYAVIQSKRGGAEIMVRVPWKERLDVTRRNLWGIMLPVIILGGIYSGAFTPTEAAAIGLVYSLFITMVVYRTVLFRDLPRICLKSITTSCMIAMIIAGALLFGRVLTFLELPQQLTRMVIDLGLSPISFILAMSLVMFVLGCILETVSIVLLTMPLVTPILFALNIDPIWYAIILVINMEMALITPPVGVNLYVIGGLRKDIQMQEIIKGVFPFMLIMVLMLALVILFPRMSLWLPMLMQ
ncbi:MAG: TRAP transporter large permease [Synergistales bacterium]|nr:TRAP transporter large permease [Synergistales bacterium]